MLGQCRSRSTMRPLPNDAQRSLQCIVLLDNYGCAARPISSTVTITTRKLVIYSADANARNHRIFEDLLWLERRYPCRSGQIQSALHRKGHHSEPGVSLGNGNQKWTAALAVPGNQWPHAGRRQRRR